MPLLPSIRKLLLSVEALVNLILSHFPSTASRLTNWRGKFNFTRGIPPSEATIHGYVEFFQDFEFRSDSCRRDAVRAASPRTGRGVHGAQGSERGNKSRWDSGASWAEG